jgi:AcrR family transcriptional regulator
VRAIRLAAVELIDAHGLAAATTNRIAERAGVSIGSLYQYFPNRDAIVADLLAEHRAAVHRVVDAAIGRMEDPELPLAESLRALLVDLVALHEADPRLTRVLSRDVRHLASSTGQRHSDGAGEAARLESILRRRAGTRLGDPRIAACIVAQTVSALTRWLVHDAPPALDRRRAIDEAMTMLCAYLGPI